MKHFVNLFALLICISGCKTTALNSKYDTYPQLGFSAIESASYELIKVAPWDSPNPASAVSLITHNETFMVELGNIEHILLDSKGNLVSSYNRSYGERLSNGVFFAKDYYVDWPLTGDKTKKQYSKHFNYSSFSKSEFNHSNKVINKEIILDIEDEITPHYQWKDPTNAIYLAAHKRKKKSSLRHSGDQSETGWDSTGYFKLKLAGESLIFKAFVFEWERATFFDTDIAMYFHPSNPELAIIIVSMNKGNNMWQVEKSPEEAGIYVVRKK